MLRSAEASIEEPMATGCAESPFEERYRVLRVLGEGATAIVFEAEDLVSGRLVAIKQIRANLPNPQEILSRFHMEAHVGGILSTPHVAQVYGTGKLADGAPYMVMERLFGETLAKRLERGTLPLHQVVDLGLQILDALEVVHEAGVLHRDIKPQNVMLQPDDERGVLVKLVDFGICKRVLPEWKDLSLTLDGHIVGTPHYMAPEQLLGDPTDERTDVYAVGVLLYEALTGDVPFDGGDALQVTASILQRMPTRPCVLRPECSRALEQIVLRAMARAPKQRHASARAMATDLRVLAGPEAWAPRHEIDALRARTTLRSRRPIDDTLVVSSSPSAHTDPASLLRDEVGSFADGSSSVLVDLEHEQTWLASLLRKKRTAWLGLTSSASLACALMLMPMPDSVLGFEILRKATADAATDVKQASSLPRRPFVRASVVRRRWRAKWSRPCPCGDGCHVIRSFAQNADVHDFRRSRAWQLCATRVGPTLGRECESSVAGHDCSTCAVQRCGDSNHGR